MKTITLTKGKITLIDDEDFEKISKYSWRALKTKNNWYAVAWEKNNRSHRKLLLLHRVITSAPAALEADHRDGNGLNNRRYNLRLCSHSQNHQAFQTKSKKASSKFRGVRFKNRSWDAQIKVSGKSVHLGRHPTEEDAARAYDKKAREVFGEFAHPNFSL